MANQTSSLVLKQTNINLTHMLEKEKDALPKGFNSLRFKQNVLTVLNDTDISNMRGQEFNLAKCIMKGAYLGLDFFNKECYVITFGKTPTFMTDYKGEEKLCRKYSINPIKDIYSKLVREGDEFEEGVERGQQYVNFKSKPFNNEKIIGAFAVVYYKDGGMQVEVMSREEIELVRDQFSKQSRGQAWSKSFGEMAKKTVLRRLCKHIQLDFDSIEQQRAWEDGGDSEFIDKNSDNIITQKSDMEKELENNGEIDSDTPVDFTDTPFEEVNSNDIK
jgi:recombination protein RecT